MSIVTFTMKTHSTTDITKDYTGINDCIVHKRQPKFLHLIVGKRREHYFVSLCEHEDCGRMTTVSGAELFFIWNKWNPINEPIK